MKKALSLLLSVVLAITIIVPGFMGYDFASITAQAATTNPGSISTKTPDAYATVFATSDFQDGRSGNLVEANFKATMNNALADGVAEPDGFILGGDYESSYADQHETPDAYHRVEDIIIDVFPYYNKKNIIAIQGNHDKNDLSVLDGMGLYEFEDYLVYAIPNEEYPAGTGGDAARQKALDTADKLNKMFGQLLAEGETRPIFIVTHIPLHHNSRNPKAENEDGSYGYNETRYGQYLFDSINSYAAVFDIIFMFGHNHSGDYDDYIGGSVNYLAKGDTIRIPKHDATPSKTSYDERILNFTYMNYGYIGYSNNKVDKTLTMSAFEICPDRIELTRYNTETEEGKERIHSKHTIERIVKRDEPSVRVIGYENKAVGSARGAMAVASGFTDPVYTWSTNNNQVAKITATNRIAQISYNQAGTATVTVTVTERNDPSKSATASLNITVTNATATTAKASSIQIADECVFGKSQQGDTAPLTKTLEFYEIEFGKKVCFAGAYDGFNTSATTSWSSSNESVATVENGEITLVGNEIGRAHV